MSVRFIIGPAASGKTRHCLEALRALERKGEPGIFLVPEQFTYSADRELLEVPDLEGLRHIRVLSFSRLATWLHELSGAASPPVILEAVRPMLLRRVLAELPEERLGPLAGMKDQQGLLEELGRFISEVRAHGSVDFLQSVHQAITWSETAWPPGTREKIRALAAAFEAYSGALRDLHRSDPEERMAGCETIIAALRDQISRIHFYVDGFLSFTRREREVLLALAQTGAPCTIAFCLDEGPIRIPFLPIQRSLTAVKEGLERSGIPLDPPLFLHPPWPGQHEGTASFGTSPALLHLERNLYSEQVRNREATTPDGSAITLQPASTPRQEVLLWARRIDRWIRLAQQPRRPSEIAVIVRSVEEYRDHIRQIFPRYGIPFFLDERRSLLSHPRVRLILDALEVLLSGWRRSAVITFLRNPLLGASPAVIDLLENLSLEYGRDFEEWFALSWPEYYVPERAHAGRSLGTEEPAADEELEPDEEDTVPEPETEDPGHPGDSRSPGGRMELVNPLRLRLLLPLREMELAWPSVLSAGGAETAAAAGGLERALSGAAAVAALERLVAFYLSATKEEQDPDPEWTARVQETVQEILDEARSLWAKVLVPMEEFARTLRQGCRAARLGLPPRRHEQVVVGDVRRSRLSGIRCAIVGGLNDGLFPLTVADDLVLTDRDRTSLASYGVTLGPPAAARQEEEVYFFYIALTRASQECLLTWSQMDDQGGPRTPSLLLQEVRRVLPGLEAQPVPGEPESGTLESLQTPEELGQRLVRHLLEGTAAEQGAPLASGQAASARVPAADPEGDWDELLQAALSSTSEGIPQREPADSLRIAGHTVRLSLPSVLYKTESRLPDELNRRLAREEEVVSSVSRLQQYAACPYQSFAEKTLRLEPRPEAVVSPLETGKLAHAALERFFRSPVNPDYGVIGRRLGEIFRELKDHPDYLAFHLDESSRHRWENTRHSLERFLRMEARRLHASAYQPKAQEISFNPREGNAVPILLPDGRRLLLIGRIDRLDSREGPDGIHGLVIDYKRSPRSGLPKALVEGRDLQLVAYLLFVRDVLQWIPAGGIYLPVLPSPKPMERIDPQSKNPLRIRAHGLFLQEEREEVDQNTGLLVGATGRGGQAVSDKDALASLLDRGRAFLASFASTQLDGWIAPVPLEIGAGRLPCAHCDYKALCRFRPGTDPVRRRPGEGMLYAPPPLEGAAS